MQLLDFPRLYKLASTWQETSQSAHASALQMLASELAGAEPSRQLTAPPGGSASRAPAARTGEEVRFTWRLENFAAFKNILETRKVFSR